MTAWVLAWLGLAWVAGDFAARWVDGEGRSFARAWTVAATYFAIPCGTGWVTYQVIPYITTFYPDI